MTRRAIAVVAALKALGCIVPLAHAQQGHVVRGNQVQVNRASHWQQWQGAASLVEITAAGIVPVRVRKDVNAALDADGFFVTTADADTPGGVSVGSNSAAAANAIDGDMTTTWGPDPDSPLKDWWLELNLGRIVVVKKIIIRFAAEGEGDPFLHFKVLGWRLPPPRSTSRYMLAGTDIPIFWEIGRTDRPNKTQRVFEFEPPPTEVADDGFVGDPLDRVLIVATQSDLLRGEEVSGGEYEALSNQQRGATEYYRRSLSGREQQVRLEEYEKIAQDRKGSIRYFRRELPRIAEIEVITEGDNINLGLVERGGSAIVETPGEGLKPIPTAADGSYTTGHNGTAFSEKSVEYLQDLGALFWVDSMHFLLDGGQTIHDWVVDVSDGTRAPDGSIRYTGVGERQSRIVTRSDVRYRALFFEPRKVRFMRATFRQEFRSFIGITEVLLYGSGYIPEVQLTSDLILFDESKNLISIDWEGDLPEGTFAQLQTRTGNELEEENLYFDSRGNAVSESKYNKLPGSRKGDITSRFLPGADWSTWSVPYTESGAEITSPSPRQFMQLRATLTTDRADEAASLQSITVNMSDPVAEHLAGEVWPLRVERIGEQEEFSLFIRPDFASGTQGFDEIRINASAGTRVELLTSSVGSDDDFEGGTTTDFTLPEMELMSSGADTLHFRLPSRVRRGTDIVEVRLRASVLGNSASFRASVREGADGLWQRVDEGDATALVNSQRLTVLALEGSAVIRDLTVASPVLSPNADGINDELVMRFAVARVAGEQPVTLTIHDLGGRIIRRLEERRSDARGQYDMRWDGSDAAGQLVAPGVYLARLDIAVDSGSARATTRLQAVYVAY